MSKTIVTREQATRRRPLFGWLTRLLNPLILTRAGSRLSAFAVIHHRGRRSGRTYATPVSARPAADGFVIPLTFGKGADWFQNVQAAGGCIIQWKGAKYAVIEPEVIDRATARSAFSPLERALLPLIGVAQFVHVRHAPTSGNLPVA
jgi:deazaflavin-dependent oxidoreductase (nitroreductase family)